MTFYHSFIESTLNPLFYLFHSFQLDPSEQHNYYMLQNYLASTVFTALSSLHDLQTIKIAHGANIIKSHKTLYANTRFERNKP